VTLKPLGENWQATLEPILAGLCEQLAPTQATLASLTDWKGVCSYLDLLVTWNKQLDLTAAHDNDALAELIFADAFVIGSFARSATSWVDVGSGSGAPGVALSLIRPDLALTLVEPLQKRVAFLRAVTGTLHERQLRVERARVEDLAAGRWDAAVSRATFEPSQWLEYGARLATGEVWVLLARAEPPQIRGWETALDLTYRWPKAGAPRRAVKYVPKIP
jgi:16S rRNA (guanine527-N7)-methyltransferase